MEATERQLESLKRAVHGQSLTNLPAIFSGFLAKGIPEAEITDKAQLALLSKLDSTGRIDGCVFVFTCNSIERFEARFLSRCLPVEFSSYGMAGDIAKYLESVWQAEGGNENRPDFTRLAKECRNNVRDCLGRLEVELLA